MVKIDSSFCAQCSSFLFRPVTIVAAVGVAIVTFIAYEKKWCLQKDYYYVDSLDILAKRKFTFLHQMARSFGFYQKETDLQKVWQVANRKAFSLDEEDSQGELAAEALLALAPKVSDPSYSLGEWRFCYLQKPFPDLLLQVFQNHKEQFCFLPKGSVYNDALHHRWYDKVHDQERVGDLGRWKNSINDFMEQHAPGCRLDFLEEKLWPKFSYLEPRFIAQSPESFRVDRVLKQFLKNKAFE